MNKEKSQIKIGAILSYIIVGINIAIGFIYTPILIRQLGQVEYGLYSLIFSFMSYLTILDFGLGNAIIVYTSRFINSKKKEEEYKLNGILVTVYFFIGLVVFILGTILYFNVERIFSRSMTAYEYNEAKKMILIFTINTAITMPLSVFSNIIIAYERFIFSKVVKIIQILSAPIITLPIIFIYPKAWIIVIVTAIVNILSLLINTIYAFVKLKIHVSFKNLDFSILKEIFNYSFYVFLQVVVDKLNLSIGQVILGATSGTIAVAVYAVGAKINHLYNTLSSALVGVTLPKIVKMEEDKKPIEEFSKIFIQTGRLQFLILALVLTGFIIFGNRFIVYWAGPEYSGAYIITVILLLGSLPPLIQSVGASILQAKNKHKFRTLILLIVAIINVIVTIPLAKAYEGLGAAIGTFLSLFIGQGIIINIYYAKEIKLDIKGFLWQIFKMSVPIVVLAVISYLIYNYLVPSNLIYVLLGIGIYTLIYSIVVWLFSMNKYEKDLVKNILIKFKIIRKNKK